MSYNIQPLNNFRIELIKLKMKAILVLLMIMISISYGFIEMKHDNGDDILAELKKKAMELSLLCLQLMQRWELI